MKDLKTKRVSNRQEPQNEEDLPAGIEQNIVLKQNNGYDESVVNLQTDGQSVPDFCKANNQTDNWTVQRSHDEHTDPK